MIVEMASGGVLPFIFGFFPNGTDMFTIIGILEKVIHQGTRGNGRHYGLRIYRREVTAPILG
jgi:hypothetical protein